MEAFWVLRPSLILETFPVWASYTSGELVSGRLGREGAALPAPITGAPAHLPFALRSLLASAMLCLPLEQCSVVGWQLRVIPQPAFEHRPSETDRAPHLDVLDASSTRSQRRRVEIETFR